MIITKVKNRTSSEIIIGQTAIPANGTTVIFYNKPFWIQKQAICNALIANQIQFIDDESNVIVSRKSEYNNPTDVPYTNELLFNQFMDKMTINWDSSEEGVSEIEEEAGRKIIFCIRGLLKRKDFDGTVVGYTKGDLSNSLSSIQDDLKGGDFASAGAKIALIPNDAFWNNSRRNRFMALCNSVSL